MKEALFPGSSTPSPFRPDQILSEASWCLSSTSMEVESAGFFYIPAVNNLKLINQNFSNQYFYQRESVAINRISGLGYLHMFSYQMTQFLPENIIHLIQQTHRLVQIIKRKVLCKLHNTPLDILATDFKIHSINLHNKNLQFCFTRSGSVYNTHLTFCSTIFIQKIMYFSSLEIFVLHTNLKLNHLTISMAQKCLFYIRNIII